MSRLLPWSVLAVIALASCAREPAVVAPSPGAGLRVLPLTTSSTEARAAFERGARLVYEGSSRGRASWRPHSRRSPAGQPGGRMIAKNMRAASPSPN
jgi:hypothetical protein